MSWYTHVKPFGIASHVTCASGPNAQGFHIDPDYLSKWSKLRKLSVSPFNNEPRIGEYLRGSRVVYYCKPRAEYVTCREPLDEVAIMCVWQGKPLTPTGNLKRSQEVAYIPAMDMS